MTDNVDIPIFSEKIFSEKVNEYVLIIPVINEGEKIKRQISKINDKNFNVDIVIADGGSTDGSLEHSYIKTKNIRALLTKNDVGNLSSQLRIAYYWSLKQGYKGIITIDGNGKDDVSHINEMKLKLDEGFDYIQGSRYTKGGVSENTPLDRIFGNRMIHVPLLSFASGFKFSDTTNGFRAYSKKFLTHPKVKPFRKIFKNYELLFYLTIRAPQLDFKVCEIPVTRKYPQNEKTPTKIKGIFSRFQILKETIFVAVGFYNP